MLHRMPWLGVVSFLNKPLWLLRAAGIHPWVSSMWTERIREKIEKLSPEKGHRNTLGSKGIKNLPFLLLCLNSQHPRDSGSEQAPAQNKVTLN